MLATTVYLGGWDEKRKIIEAQWCANTIWWEINNFIFYTLTSKHLKIDDNNTISPSYYIIQLTWCNESWACDKINLAYDTWNSSINTYKTLSVSNTCNQTRQPIKFYRTWNNPSDINYIKMNKWLSPKNINERNVFYIETTNAWKEIIGDIIAAICLDKNCTGSPKEFWKFRVDWRSQTISRKNCKFYDDDPTKCKEREN
jgi:hypothetical protein